MAFNLDIFHNSNIFFTSDTHFCHNKSFLYGDRGFSSIEEHDETLVERWNETVKPNDIVIHLGDMCLKDNEKAAEYIRQLNGITYWLLGNHDTDNRVAFIRQTCNNIKLFEDNLYAQLCKYHNFRLYCSHYPTCASIMDNKHFSQHIISLYGHTHAPNPWTHSTSLFMYNVGVDAHYFAPVALETILASIRLKWEMSRQ